MIRQLETLIEAFNCLNMVYCSRYTHCMKCIYEL